MSRSRESEGKILGAFPYVFSFLLFIMGDIKSKVQNKNKRRRGIRGNRKVRNENKVYIFFVCECKVRNIYYLLTNKSILQAYIIKAAKLSSGSQVASKFKRNSLKMTTFIFYISLRGHSHIDFRFR